jgi:hypothetical protein
LPTILEPKLEGEIAIRRRPAGARTLSALATAPPQPGAAPPSARPPQAPVEIADFECVEDYLRAYLEDERFRSTHPLACGRWIVAWEMLWCADSRTKVIAVGQRAREAMHAFSASLVEASTPLAMDTGWPELLAESARRPDPVDGVAGVVGAYREQLGEERSELLGGLLEHWRALAESVSRHEHGVPAGAERLRWEDGRRLALFTALVMVEIDRSFA